MFKPIAECMTVAELLEDPERWAKHYYAFNAQGGRTVPYSAEACKFCMAGALIRVIDNHRTVGKDIDSIHLYKRLGEAIGAVFPTLNTSIALFNDHEGTTHEMVLAVLKEAGV